MKPDEYQLSAIKCSNNLLLIAGAGAGKTYTITEKIKYLIEELYLKEQEILVISFTNKSVEDLKSRINYNIDIMTFHKLAISILNNYNINYKLVSDNYLDYITDEFFQSLSNKEYIKELLKYFRMYDYNSFLDSYNYIELKKLIINLIKIFKTNNKTKEDFKSLFKVNSILSKYTYIIKCIYENDLKSNNSFDFDDLIIKATETLNKPTKYKYIIVDEFQDTSEIRFNLVNKIRDISNATLFCVGDDYQSIYHFSGCNINIFLNYTNLIPNSIILKLKYTYRNSQELINISSNFVMKNNSQIKKELLSNKHIKKPIEYIYYINPKNVFEKIYYKLKQEGSLLVLGRNNFDIKKFTNKIIPEFMSVHSSKGLESDNVILINLVNDTYGFPNKIVNSNLLEELHPSDKSYLFAEERRLFYVALTRTRNKVYILVPYIKKSIFIKELKNLT